MIPREILKKVRRVEITTRGLVNEVFSGEYHSVFKGRGMDFAEVREYQYGDDIRSIDWNVTARTGTSVREGLRGGARAHRHAGGGRECLRRLRDSGAYEG